jgi:hypothetical protein
LPDRAPGDDPRLVSAACRAEYDSSHIRKVGRPRKAADIFKLVLELVRDNPGWGYTRIRDALRGLKIEIGRTTVANMLAQAGIEPAPERNRKRTWKHFLKSHWETLYACDFFGVEVLGMFGTVRHMVFFVVEVKSRAVQIAGVRIAPDGDWMKQIARHLLDPADGFLRHASHLIHDRDPVFTEAWTALLTTGGREVRADSGAESELQPARGAFCENGSDRVFGSLRHFRRAAPAAPDQGVHGALSDRAPPPRDRQPDHQTEGIAKQRQRDAGHDRMPVASRRTAQLLLPGGRMTHAATAFRTPRAERVRLTRSILPHTNTPWHGAVYRTDTVKLEALVDKGSLDIGHFQAEGHGTTVYFVARTRVRHSPWRRRRP